MVALVVTIILLLILVGISIATLTGSGLFEKARLAEKESKNAQEKEDATLKDYENKINDFLINSATREQNNNKIYKVGIFESTSVDTTLGIYEEMIVVNTIDIDIKEKYNNYKNLTKDNFFAIDSLEFVDSDSIANFKKYGGCSTKIIEYNSENGILKLIKPFGFREGSTNSLDKCYLGSTTIYLIENMDIIEL